MLSDIVLALAYAAVAMAVAVVGLWYEEDIDTFDASWWLVVGAFWAVYLPVLAVSWCLMRSVRTLRELFNAE